MWENVMSGVPLVPEKPELFLFTDASLEGWGAHLEDQEVSGLWSEVEKSHHINNLEFLAVVNGLRHWAHVVRGKRVQVVTDNSTVVAYICKQGGTKSLELLQLTQELFQLVDSLQCSVSCRHIPGRSNVWADSLSRKRQIIVARWTTPLL